MQHFDSVELEKIVTIRCKISSISTKVDQFEPPHCNPGHRRPNYLEYLSTNGIYWIRHKCNDGIYLLWTAIFAGKRLKSTNHFILRQELIHANITFV